MDSYQTERERFVDAWARNGGHYVQARDVLQGALAVAIAVMAECSGTLTARQKARRQRAEGFILAMCEALGFSVRFGGDPRGYTTKITFPDGSWNTFGGREDGWGVPTR